MIGRNEIDTCEVSWIGQKRSYRHEPTLLVEMNIDFQIGRKANRRFAIKNLAVTVNFQLYGFVEIFLDDWLVTCIREEKSVLRHLDHRVPAKQKEKLVCAKNRLLKDFNVPHGGRKVTLVLSW